MSDDSSSSGGREMTEVTCSECKKKTEVPFKPTSDRPVYCRDCFAKKRQSRGGPGGRGRGPNRPVAKQSWRRDEYPGYDPEKHAPVKRG